MIESYAYEIIKEEGFKEGIKEGKEEGIKEGKEEGIKVGKEEGIKVGIKEGKIEEAQDAVLEVLEVRFEIVSLDIVKNVKNIKEIVSLESLLKKAVKVGTMREFRDVLKKVTEEME